VKNFANERSTFPILGERSYLASQSIGPFPREMLDDLRAYEQSLHLRNRGIEQWAQRWVEMHALTEALLHAPAGSVFLRDSATAAQAAIAAAIEPENERRRIVISSADFHSSRYLWQAQASRGFEVVEVPPDAAANEDAIMSLFDERTRIVALTLVSPRSGAMLDAARLAQAAHRVGAILILDVYQAIGVVPVQIAALGADVVIGGFHKWIGGGGTGLAFGYIEPSFGDKLEPVYPGWTAHARLLGFEDHFHAASGAQKFQQGMPPMEPIYTSRAGIQWVQKIGIDAIREKSLVLTNRLLRRAIDARMHVRTPLEAHRRGGMIVIDVKHGYETVRALAERNIDIDFRPGAGLRIGPHVCLSEDECDRTIDAIVEFEARGN